MSLKSYTLIHEPELHGAVESKRIICHVVVCPSLSTTGPVAQWIRHRPTEPIWELSNPNPKCAEASEHG